ncbi:MAG: endonuclease/exonuclease/phosphatase family protein, partial [Acidimicrobiia bacterium]
NENVPVRAQLIADSLASGRFDVIAFNEVWDEDDGKDVLWAGLCATYPYYVKYVDTLGAAPAWGPVPAPGAVPVIPYPGEDSGLMLFSKFPFEPLPSDHFESEDNETSYGDDSDLIASVMFEDCDDVDCYAAKGPSWFA